MAPRKVAIGKVLEQRMRSWSPYMDLRALSYKLPRIMSQSLNIDEKPNVKLVTSQAKLLCQEYIFTRLHKHGLVSAKMNLLRITSSSKLSDVSKEIILIGSELERLYPTVYNNVAKQLASATSTEMTVRKNLKDVADAMFRGNLMTWARVVSLFAVSAGYACDCVVRGHAECVQVIVETFTEIISTHVAPWIADQGGWRDVIRVFHATKETSVLLTLTLLGALCGIFTTFVALLNT